MNGMLEIGMRLSRDGLSEALPFALLGILCFWAILKLRRSGSMDSDGGRDEVTVVLDRDDAEVLSDHGRASETEVKKLYSNGTVPPAQGMEGNVQLIGWNTEENETQTQRDMIFKIIFFDEQSEEDKRKVLSFMNQYKWKRAEEIAEMTTSYNEKLKAQKERKKATKPKDEGRLFGDGTANDGPAGEGTAAMEEVTSVKEDAMIDSAPQTFDFGGMDNEKGEAGGYGDAEVDIEEV